MRKNYFSAAFCLLFISNCFAQSNKDNGTVSLSAGASMPVGSYAGKNITDPGAGFASLGESFNISYAHLLKHRFGLTAVLFGQRNPVNTKALDSDLSQQQFSTGPISSSSGQPPPQPTFVTYPNWNFEKKAWLSGSLLLGGYADLPLSTSGLSFTPRVLIGIAYTSSPALSGSSLTDTSLITIQQSSGKAFAFAFLIGGGIKYNINQRICFLSGLDLFGTSKIRFKNINETVTILQGSLNLGNTVIQQASFTADEKQTITSLNLTIGIGLRL